MRTITTGKGVVDALQLLKQSSKIQKEDGAPYFNIGKGKKKLGIPSDITQENEKKGITSGEKSFSETGNQQNEPARKSMQGDLSRDA